MKPTRLVLAAGFVFIGGIALLAQAPATPAIAGFWLVQDTASGSWQEWWDNGPGVKAKVRPEIVKLNGEVISKACFQKFIDSNPPAGRKLKAEAIGTVPQMFTEIFAYLN